METKIDLNPAALYETAKKHLRATNRAAEEAAKARGARHGIRYGVPNREQKTQYDAEDAAVQRWENLEQAGLSKLREAAQMLVGIEVRLTGLLHRSEQEYGGGIDGMLGSGRWQTRTWTIEATRHKTTIESVAVTSNFMGQHEVLCVVNWAGKPATFKLCANDLEIDLL